MSLLAGKWLSNKLKLKIKKGENHYAKQYVRKKHRHERGGAIGCLTSPTSRSKSLTP
jgi:hypothetical protein